MSRRYRQAVLVVDGISPRALRLRYIPPLTPEQEAEARLAPRTHRNCGGSITRDQWSSDYVLGCLRCCLVVNFEDTEMDE